MFDCQKSIVSQISSVVTFCRNRDFEKRAVSSTWCRMGFQSRNMISMYILSLKRASCLQDYWLVQSTLTKDRLERIAHDVLTEETRQMMIHKSSIHFVHGKRQFVSFQQKILETIFTVICACMWK